MTSTLTRLAIPAAAAGQAALALLVWKVGSTSPIPMHLGLTGQVDRWGDRTEAALLLCGLAALTLVGGWALGWSGRKPEADEARRRGLGWAQAVLVASTCVLAVMMTGLATIAADSGVDSARLALIGLCALLTIIGSVVGKVAPNALVGVRTPWSLNSRLSWEKSNRLAGRLFFWGGLVGVLLALAVPAALGQQIILGAVLLIAAVCVFESWRVWRADPERRVV